MGRFPKFHILKIGVGILALGLLGTGLARAGGSPMDLTATFLTPITIDHFDPADPQRLDFGTILGPSAQQAFIIQTTGQTLKDPVDGDGAFGGGQQVGLLEFGEFAPEE